MSLVLVFCSYSFNIFLFHGLLFGYRELLAHRTFKLGGNLAGIGVAQPSLAALQPRGHRRH